MRRSSVLSDNRVWCMVHGLLNASSILLNASSMVEDCPSILGLERLLRVVVVRKSIQDCHLHVTELAHASLPLLNDNIRIRCHLLHHIRSVSDE